jgi:hypothetical protein
MRQVVCWELSSSLLTLLTFLSSSGNKKNVFVADSRTHYICLKDRQTLLDFADFFQFAAMALRRRILGISRIFYLPR